MYCAYTALCSWFSLICSSTSEMKKSVGCVREGSAECFFSWRSASFSSAVMLSRREETRGTWCEGRDEATGKDIVLVRTRRRWWSDDVD